MKQDLCVTGVPAGVGGYRRVLQEGPNVIKVYSHRLQKPHRSQHEKEKQTAPMHGTMWVLKTSADKETLQAASGRKCYPRRNTAAPSAEKRK